MADPRFFDVRGPFSLEQIAHQASATLASGVDGATKVNEVAALSEAAAGQLSFYQNNKYADALAATKASAVIMRSNDADKAPSHVAVLIADNPHKAYALAVQMFYPTRMVAPGISPSAHIDPTAILEEGAAIGPGVVIGPGVSVGAGTEIGANTVIEANVQIGRDCQIANQVSISHALIGNKVTLHPGVRIGQPGFGFAIDLAGHVMLPQLGRVIVQDGANIGANTCIDRGASEDTVIGEGAFLDNQIQIGHNVKIGRHCVLSGQCGIAGSSVIEDYAVLAGAVGVADHITIGVGAQVGGRSAVITNIPAGERWVGLPAMPARQFMRQVAMMKKLSQNKPKRKE